MNEWIRIPYHLRRDMGPVTRKEPMPRDTLLPTS